MKSPRFYRIALALVILLSSLLVIDDSWGISIDLKAILTGEVDDSGYISDRNVLSALQGGAVSALDVYGFMKFDLSALPDDSLVTAMDLTTYHFVNPGPNKSPYNDPTVQIRYSSDDSWMRVGTTDLSLLGNTLGSGQDFPTGDPDPFLWTLNPNAIDWSVDLLDNFLTLAMSVVESDYRFVYWYGSGGTNFPDDPQGTYAPVLHLNYEERVAPIPEPSAVLLVGAGLIGLLSFRRKLRSG